MPSSAREWGQLARSGWDKFSAFTRRRPKLSGAIGIAFLLVFFVGRSGGCNRNPPLPISAHEIHEAYQGNEVAADEAFEGYAWDVTGTVESVGVDLLGDPFVVLRSGGFMGIHMTFENSHRKQLAELSVGELVTIRGVCKGKTLAVIFKHCRVIARQKH